MSLIKYVEQINSYYLGKMASSAKCLTIRLCSKSPNTIKLYYLYVATSLYKHARLPYLDSFHFVSLLHVIMRTFLGQKRFVISGDEHAGGV